MTRFSYKVSGIGNCPTTLSSLGKRFVLKFWEEKGIDLNNFVYFDKYKLTDFYSMFTPKGLQTTKEVGLATPLFLASLRGGRNESYVFGRDNESTWYDYDLTSAYTTAMSVLGIPNFFNTKFLESKNKMIDFINNHDTKFDLFDEAMSENIYLENSFSVFYVKFKFKEDTLYPCLGISLDDTSVLYPLQGETLATGYEIYLALSMGCEIQLIRGAIIPFASPTKPYFEVINYLQEQRRNHKELYKATKDSIHALYDLLYKEMGNSVYGQTAQGLGTIRRLNTRSGKLEDMDSSILSNPIIASHITGLIRAVLGEIMRQVHNMGGRIISCTTDGFLTDIEDLPNKLDKNSRLLKIYADIREKLSNNREILELKSSSKGILTWSTRGQQGLDPSSKISAMTGFQPKYLTMEERINLVEQTFKAQSYDIYYGQTSLRKVNDIYKEGGQVSTKITEKRFRTVYDNRREIIDTGIKPYEGLLFSRPWLNKEIATTVKLIGSLGADIYAPNSGYTNKSGSKDYVDITLRSFLRALLKGQLNLVNPFDNYQEIIEYVKDTFNLTIKPNYIATQKRRQFIPKIVPNNMQTRDLVQKILIKFPHLDVDNFMK